jgi:hypothetical protein
MGELTATLVVKIFRWIFISIVFDIGIKIPGYAIARLLANLRRTTASERGVSPDGAMSTCCGLLFWGGIGYAVYRLWK